MTPTARKANNGSAIVWSLVWIAGLTALSWAAVTIAMPRFEKKQRSAVVRAVTDTSNSPVSMGIKGFTATLSGEVSDEANKLAILNSLGLHTGILHVRDRLSVSDPALDELPSVSFTPVPSLVTSDNTSPLIPFRQVDELELDTPDEATTAQPANLDPDIDSEPAQAISTDSPATSETGASALELPSLSIRLAGDIMAIEGVLSPDDNPTALIQQAMDAFDVDVVSNAINFKTSTASSDWLSAIEDLVPLMSPLQDPRLEVSERQITLSGTAADKQVHDAIIAQALSQLESYSLVERIVVAQTPEIAEATSTRTTDDPVQPKQQTEDLPQATTAAGVPAVTALVVAQAPTSTIESGDLESLAAVEAETTDLINLTAANAPITQADIKPPVVPTQDSAPDQLETQVEPEAVAPDSAAQVDATIEAAAAEAETEAKAEAEAEAKAKAEAEAAAKAETKAKAEAEAEAEATAGSTDSSGSAAAESEAPFDITETATDDAASSGQADSQAAPEISESQTAQTEASPPTEPQPQDSSSSDTLSEALSELLTEPVLFESESDVIAEQSLEVLNKIANVLIRFPETPLSIEGHTDSTGSTEANLALSLERAIAVRAYLVERGVPILNLRARGFGEEVPIESNQTSNGRATNRRIEFKF